MDFVKWMMMDMLGDGFTVIAFGIMAICLAVIVRDGLKYGWTYEEETE